jgi:signal transduction histidine kinase
MSNAIKFSNEAGAINISTKTSEKSVDIIFEDSGIGISVGKIKDIMEPFGQINDPKLNKGQGTGLGLPIAKAMMEMHGGDLKIESIEGEGTSVICRFPAERVSRK